MSCRIVSGKHQAAYFAVGDLAPYPDHSRQNNNLAM